MNKEDDFSDLLKLFDEPQPLQLGNTKPNRCGMCGIKTKKLYPRMVGKINFYICGFCKSIMEEGE